MSKGPGYATLITASNLVAWKDIEPVLKMPYAGPVKSDKREKQDRERPSTQEKFTKKQDENKDFLRREPIKNPKYSFTTFLIPLYITGSKQDYQLLYCICAIKNALKTMSTILRKEGFAQLYMFGMKSEVNWEEVKENNITFTDMIIEFLLKSGTVCMVAANKKEITSKVHNTDAPFVVLLTATDIHMPCQAHLCVGTAWMVFRRTVASRKNLFDREVLNCGRRALHSGLLVNGCNTIMACGFKELGGIHYFIFDVTTGDFILHDKGCFIREYGNLLTTNEGLFYKLPPPVQEWLTEKKRNKINLEYCSRHTGGWITDGYRILRSGGLMFSLDSSETQEGKVKFLCKAAPLAYLIEKAGGRASNGHSSVLRVKSIRSRSTSFILGSVREVDNYISKCISSPRSFHGFGSSQESDDTSTDPD